MPESKSITPEPKVVRAHYIEDFEASVRRLEKCTTVTTHQGIGGFLIVRCIGCGAIYGDGP